MDALRDEFKNTSREDLLRGIAFLRGEVCLREEVRQVMAKDIARLRKVERAARSLLSREDFWQSAAMLVTLPGEIDNLADALAEQTGDARKGEP